MGVGLSSGSCLVSWACELTSLAHRKEGGVDPVWRFGVKPAKILPIDHKAPNLVWCSDAAMSKVRRAQGPAFTDTEKGAIFAHALNNLSAASMIRKDPALKGRRPRSIQKLVQRVQERHTADPAPKSGAPRKSTEEQDRLLVKLVMQNRLLTAPQLKKKLQAAAAERPCRSPPSRTA